MLISFTTSSATVRVPLLVVGPFWCMNTCEPPEMFSWFITKRPRSDTLGSKRPLLPTPKK